MVWWLIAATGVCSFRRQEGARAATRRRQLVLDHIKLSAYAIQAYVVEVPHRYLAHLALDVLISGSRTAVTQ